MASSDFISKSEAARRLGINRVTLCRWIAAGRLPTDEQGRIPRAAFEHILNPAGEVRGGTAAPVDLLEPHREHAR